MLVLGESSWSKMIALTCHALKPGLSELQDIKKEKNQVKLHLSNLLFKDRKQKIKKTNKPGNAEEVWPIQLFSHLTNECCVLSQRQMQTILSLLLSKMLRVKVIRP